MTSKERVSRAIHFQTPDRIPSHLPEPYDNDIVWIFPQGKNLKEWNENGKRYRLSEWGSTWQVVSDENMGEVVIPAIQDWSEYDNYIFPREINSAVRYSHMQSIIDSNKDKYIMGVIGNSIFPHYWEIRGMVGFFEDLYDNTDNMEKVLDTLVDMQLEAVEVLSQYDIDGIVVGFDDWGLQDTLMINPDLWREYFKPRYKKVWDKIHSYGLDVILHSCGNILSILDDMIQIGLNVINMDQQENMGFEQIGKFKGKICFWNPADIQTKLIKGTDEEIDEYIKQMIQELSDKTGGYIGKHYTQPNGAGHSKERSEASFNALIKYRNLWG